MFSSPTVGVCQRMSGTKRGTKLSEAHGTECTQQPDLSAVVTLQNSPGAAHNPLGWKPEGRPSSRCGGILGTGEEQRDPVVAVAQVANGRRR
jgi:hypothetical protein